MSSVWSVYSIPNDVYIDVSTSLCNMSRVFPQETNKMSSDRDDDNKNTVSRFKINIKTNTSVSLVTK